MSIYVNGVLDGTATSPSDFLGNEIINIGRAQTAREFQGRMDNIRVFKRALTDGEILLNAEGALATNGTDVAFDYRFHDSPTGIATDSSVQELHGTFVSTPTVVNVTDQAWTVSGAAIATGSTSPVTFTPSDNGIAMVKFKGDQFPVVVLNGTPSVITTPNLGLANGGAGVREGQAISLGTSSINAPASWNCR